MNSRLLPANYRNRSCFRFFGILGQLLGISAVAWGQAPHEVLVVANRREAASVRIAQAYVQQRGIPRQNLVLLSIDPGAEGNYSSIARADYTTQIWEPVQAAVQRRGLEHTLAWVFSTHIPYRVEHDPPVSVQGLTFVRNVLPSRDAIIKAEYESPLFAGPSAPQGRQRATHGLGVAAQVLGDRMPLPSISLGYMGPRGNSEAEILRMLARSVRADGSAPSGSVYLVTGEDIRARVRTWQFAPVVAALAQMGMEAVVTNVLPQGAAALFGVMVGERTVDPARMGTFVPGAVAEHLTSFGAAFDVEAQTKISRWVAAGVSGTAGTVTEPYAVWAKFPHARLHLHYRVGATLLESFYLSLRSPLQTYVLGDPLTAPWAPPFAQLGIAGVTEGEHITAPRTIDLHIRAPKGTQFARFVYLVNGQLAGEGPSFTLDPADVPPGLHVLRAVAYRAGALGHSVHGEVRFRIAP